METLLKLADALIEKKIELGIYNKSPQRPELERRSLVDSFSPEQKKRVAEARTQILAIIEAAKRGDPSLFVRAEDVHVARVCLLESSNPTRFRQCAEYMIGSRLLYNFSADPLSGFGSWIDP